MTDPVIEQKELNLRKRLLHALNDKEIEAIAKEYAKENKIDDVDVLEMHCRMNKKNTEAVIKEMSELYKLPYEITRDVYEFSIMYPTVKDLIMDEKARKIWSKKYGHNEEVCGVEVISSKPEEKKAEQVIDDEKGKGKEPLKQE